MKTIEKIDWSKIDLGKRTDQSIADELGLCKSQVCRARTARGIPAYRRELMKTIEKIDWSKIDLGKRTDQSIADELGIFRAQVRRARTERGIPVYKQKHRLSVGETHHKTCLNCEYAKVSKPSGSEIKLYACSLGYFDNRVSAQRADDTCCACADFVDYKTSDTD